MRQIIAMEVASDLETYNEAMLGKPNVEYCNWIQQPSSWGGAIEVCLSSIIASLLGVILVNVHIQHDLGDSGVCSDSFVILLSNNEINIRFR